MVDEITPLTLSVYMYICMCVCSDTERAIEDCRSKKSEDQKGRLFELDIPEYAAKRAWTRSCVLHYALRLEAQLLIDQFRYKHIHIHIYIAQRAENTINYADSFHLFLSL
jgi:hypothetical protein